MRVVGSTRFYLNPSEKETLDQMARDRHRGSRALDGDGSDGDSSESLEEISAEDFKQEGRDGRSRMWMGYPMSKNYAPNLYSFAWAQAVQNKPLGLNLMPLTAGDLAAKDAATVKKEKAEACDEIIEDSSQDGDGEMEEEGELEEGEIELGSESVVVDETTDLPSDGPQNEREKKESEGEESQEIGDFDRRVGFILEELDAITVEEAETSFDGVCSRLRKSFEDLKPMFTGIESSDTVLHALVQQAFMGIQTIYSALASVTVLKKEQNKQLLLRLLIHIKNQYSVLFTPEQVKEIDTLVNSLVFEDQFKEKVQHGGNENNMNNNTVLSKDSEISSSGSKLYLGPKAIELYTLELPIPTAPRNRVEYSPLLDLHADYDEDSLPSPTRENLPRFSIPKPVGLGMVPPASSHTIAIKIEEAEDAAVDPYVTDALKAVSSYQLKFGSSSFLSSNRLPSPTPSEEGVKEDDSHDEVSSCSVAANVRTVNTAVSPVVMSSCSDQLNSVKLVGKVSTESKPVFKPALKSRDPRLKFMKSEVRGSSEGNRGALDNVIAVGTSNARKHKIFDDPLPGDHIMKRKRNGFTSSRDLKIASGNDGPLEDSSITSESSDKNQANENFQVDMRKPGTSIVGSDRNLVSKSNFSVLNGPNSNSSSNSASVISLPSLLKAVNPTILMQLHQMEQKRIAAENQQKANASFSVMENVSSENGLFGSVSSLITTSLRPEDAGTNQLGMSQITPQLTTMSTQNDIGRIRMKPRDPRRVLHNNMLQKHDAVLSEQNPINGASSGPQSSMECLSARELAVQAHSNVLPTQFSSPPNVSQQLTKNPAEFSSNSQLVSSSEVSHSNDPPIPNKANQGDVKPTSAALNDSKAFPVVVSEASARGALQSTIPWGDMDHLLDGYNDEQKAAIQRERARRISEQNTMFAAGKLCLVLDLDHTLLNSAKFTEVDPVHEEILRRKEEQDREMSQRHLFRLQHMGMWTKLRPGIWNFLEKASKLYELHLYTMGNKLYATEMAKVLDPTGTLFSGRVMSRGDDADPFDGDERVPKIKDLDGVLGMESSVVIIDDSLRVWPHNKHNLIVVERYTYFPSSRRQFGLLGPSLLEIDHDERPEDGTLASSLAVIERLHQIFFSHQCLKDVDVRNILAAEQRKILAGCHIVFSRVFPVGEANPHLHPLWQTAEQFGAVCTNQIDEQVTHVVANSLGTDKVNWALSTGRFVVHPGWVEASALLYRRANEHDFAVKTMT